MGEGVFLGFWAWGFWNMVLRGFWAWDLRVDSWHMGITGFWEYGFGIFWLGILGLRFGIWV